MVICVDLRSETPALFTLAYGIPMARYAGHIPTIRRSNSLHFFRFFQAIHQRVMGMIILW